MQTLLFKKCGRKVVLTGKTYSGERQKPKKVYVPLRAPLSVVIAAEMKDSPSHRDRQGSCLRLSRGSFRAGTN